VASAKPYANHLHLPLDRWPCQHPITQTGSASERAKALKALINTNNTNTNKKSQSNLRRAVSSLLIAENNYATKSPLVTLGWCTFTPKLPLPLQWSPPPSNTPNPRLIPLTTPNSNQIQSAVLPQFTPRQTTDRWVRQQVCTETCLHSVYWL